MVKGEKRATLLKGFKDVGEGIHNLAIGFGSAILNPQTIPNKLDTAFDAAIVKPTLRTVDFIDETAQKVMTVTDDAFNRQVKQAQEGARNLKVVFAQPLPAGSFEAKNYPKCDRDNELIDAALMSNFVFNHLPPSKRVVLVDAFEPIMVKTGTKIIEEGDVGDYFYVIGSGAVAFEIGGKELGMAKTGASFGELALLYQAPRAATCVAKTLCGLFRLDQETFRRIQSQLIQDAKKEVCEILQRVDFFKDLDETYLCKIASNLKPVNFDDGDVLKDRVDMSGRFFILKQGEIEATSISVDGSAYKDFTLKPGDSFGSAAMVLKQEILFTGVAKGRVTVLTLDRDTFVRTLGDNWQTLVRRSTDKAKLRLIPFGKRKGPADNELDMLAAEFVDKKYPKGHVFFTEGKRTSPTLYLMREGNVSIQSSNKHEARFLENLLGFSVGSTEIKTIGRNGYFGNDTLGDNEKGEFGIAKYTVEALEEVTVGVLDLNAIRSVVVAKDDISKPITHKDLTMVRILGAGTFGKVWLVQHKGTSDAYALKVQVKKQVIEYNQDQGVIREKDIMAQLNNPFIIRMVTSYQDEYKLYMLLTLYQGGELQTIIHTDKRDGVPEWAAKFYAANMLEGLSYMHNRHVIYRDLKPENVLLDSEGYTVIVDLGFSKVIKDKTYTFCGTPLYLAPEIITQKGHDKGADHWSWGVLLYEMIVGMTPFYDGIVDQMGLFKNIVKCKMEFPEGDFMSSDAIDLVKRILTVNPNDRLGSFANAEKDIKNHRFFDEIDWEKLATKKIEVPFKPKVKDLLDGSNFDDYSKLEAKEKKAKMTKLTAAEQNLFMEF